MSKSTSDRILKRFRIAFSFAGEKRNYVEQVARILANRFGETSILYDKFHEAEFARSDLGIYLPELYNRDSELVVVVVSPDYDEKEWTGLEWLAIHGLFQQRRREEVLLCRFGHAHMKGLPRGAGFIELDQKTPEQFSNLILERLALNEGKPKHRYTNSITAKGNKSKQHNDQGCSNRTNNHQIFIGASDLIPDEFSLIRENAIDECVFLVGMPHRDVKPISLKEHSIMMKNIPSFFTPSGELSELRNSILHAFPNNGEFPTPRFSLRELQIDTKDRLSHGMIRVETQLTDWCQVHSIQDSLKFHGSTSDHVRNAFWLSVNSLVGSKKASDFPHHLSTHCLVVSKDKRLLLNKRNSVSNQRGRISASFEEQMQVACVHPPFKEEPFRFIDGDESPFLSIVRGAKEEFCLELDLDSIRILAVCMEASSIAVNFLAIAHSTRTIDEIYSQRNGAEDASENLMIPPDKSPLWTIESMLPFLERDGPFEGDKTYPGRWHASSRARIVLGLIHDFGFDQVAAHVTWEGRRSG